MKPVVPKPRRCAIYTRKERHPRFRGVSTNVLAAGTIRFTPDNQDTRDAAARLPLGHAERFFLHSMTPPSFQKTCAFSVRRIGRLQAPTKCDPSAGR